MLFWVLETQDSSIVKIAVLSLGRKHKRCFHRLFHLIPILLISFHEELSLQQSHHLHYGGRDPQVITGIVKFVYKEVNNIKISS